MVTITIRNDSLSLIDARVGTNSPNAAKIQC